MSFKNSSILLLTIQSNKKENKSEQALQIIGHVVAESTEISVQCMGVDNLRSKTLFYNK
jgi:hypothetical protein